MLLPVWSHPHLCPGTWATPNILQGRYAHWTDDNFGGLFLHLAMTTVKRKVSEDLDPGCLECLEVLFAFLFRILKKNHPGSEKWVLWNNVPPGKFSTLFPLKCLLSKSSKRVRLSYQALSTGTTRVPSQEGLLLRTWNLTLCWLQVWGRHLTEGERILIQEWASTLLYLKWRLW